MKDNHTGNNNTVQEILEAEFCPPLDSALVAALVAERDDIIIDTSRESDNEETILQRLRETLSSLARDAAEQMDSAIANELANAHISSQSATTDEVDSLFDPPNDAVSNSGTSSASTSSNLPLASALRFLQASFPFLPLSKLKAVLRDSEISGNDDDNETHELNMEHIVEVLLNEDYVRELEERGYEDEELADEAEKWQSVISEPDRRRISSQQKPIPSKKKSKGTKISLVDIRHRQRAPSSTPSSPLPTDPWNQLSSLCSYLSTLFPPRPATFFSPYFHSPNHRNPADALRAALQTIHKDRSTPNVPSITNTIRKTNSKNSTMITIKSNNTIPEPNEDTTTSLFYLFDILYSSSEYDGLDDDERAQLLSDGQLALDAVGDVSDVTLEVVRLLQDLHQDRKSSKQEMGIYHVAPPTVSSPSSPASTTLQKSLHIQIPPPTVIHPSRPPPAPNQQHIHKKHPQRSYSYCGPSSTIQDSSQWATVKSRGGNGKDASPGFSPLAEFIPAYNPLNVPRKVKARAAAKGGLTELSTSVQMGTASAPNSPLLSSGGVSGLRLKDTGSYYKDNLHDLRRRRDEALREASRYWQRGSAKSRGGEAALYFAQRAREISEEARQVKLNAARQLVDSKRTSNGDPDTIDLHYTTTNEAVIIVKEVLEEGWVCSGRPLKIVTGRGSHSTNGVGVLGPTVKKALESEGWNVERWSAGLLVRGRATSSR